MRHRKLRGHASCRHDTQGEVGQEWFGVSVEHDGGSEPMVGVVYKDLEYVGDEDTEVAAGRFHVRHVRIHPVMGAMASWPPLDLWVAGEDFLLTRLRWDLLSTTCELTQVDGDFG